MLVHIVIGPRRRCRRGGGDDTGGILPEIQAVVGGVHLHELIAEKVSAKQFARGGDVIPIRIGQGHDGK
jgi:hypothetical protein